MQFCWSHHPRKAKEVIGRSGWPTEVKNLLGLRMSLVRDREKYWHGQSPRPASTMRISYGLSVFTSSNWLGYPRKSSRGNAYRHTIHSFAIWPCSPRTVVANHDQSNSNQEEHLKSRSFMRI